ncbi:multidrug resistance-associated protein 5 [Tanacetum coccineum]
MINPCMKVKEIIDSILKKYKCKVSISQARRGKMKALQQYETCLEDHYGMLFYVCFKGLKEGWLQGCRRVIGIDGCFLKTICKGELLLAVGRGGNNQIYLIGWVVVNVENKDDWSWFMELLINDLGLVSVEGLTIISDQHKLQNKNLFWKAAKATYPTRFNKVIKEIKSINKEAYKYLMDRQPESWSRAYFTTDKACDVVENGISECFNALIVDARRKLETDIRQKDENRSQNDKTEHENGKTVRSQKDKVKVKVNPGMWHWKDHLKPNPKT